MIKSYMSMITCSLSGFSCLFLIKKKLITLTILEALDNAHIYKNISIQGRKGTKLQKDD